MTAMPPREFPTSASLKLALNRLDTAPVVTDPADVSSASAARLALPEAVGAKLFAVTEWFNTTVPVLYAVVPPLVDTSTVAAVVTVVLESMSSAVIVGAVPYQPEAGRKRRLSALFNVNEVEAALIVDSAVQVLPSDVYCQVPFAPSAV